MKNDKKLKHEQEVTEVTNKAVLHKGGHKNIFGQSEEGQARINKESQAQKPKRNKLKG